MNSEHKAIIGRVEAVRGQVGLSKLRFSEAFGMTPQTYNNFVGAQGSKPSVDLLIGVARAFGVSLDWLCFERGPMYRDAQTLSKALSEAHPGMAFATRQQLESLAEQVEALQSTCGEFSGGPECAQRMKTPATG